VAFSNADGGVVLIGLQDDGAIVARALDARTRNDIHRAMQAARDVGRYGLSQLDVDGKPVAVHRSRDVGRASGRHRRALSAYPVGPGERISRPAPRDRTDATSTPASRLLTVEALQRPLESAPGAGLALPRPGFSTEAVQTPARVNVTCVTPLGEEVASTS
jgi:hypothetical protein